MPIYEYEPLEGDCLMCNGRVEVLQSIEDDPCKYCPYCGQEVRRLISKAGFRVDRTPTPEKAAELGFTTFRRAEFGRWEKVAGPGVDAIVGSAEDIEAVRGASPKSDELD